MTERQNKHACVCICVCDERNRALQYLSNTETNVNCDLLFSLFCKRPRQNKRYKSISKEQDIKYEDKMN